jgi:hypothetical protein
VNPITATAGNNKARLSWSEPNDGGSAITGYTLTYSPGGSTPINLPATPTSYTVTGLTNGTDYTFTLTANNIAGSSAPNTSDSVTPNYTVIATTLAGNPAGDSYGTALGMGYADGTGEDARFWEPRGLAIDLSGNIIVGDFYNNRIRKVTPAGVVTTLAGSGLSAFSDGTGDDASFYQPYGVAVDLSGNIIVADGGNRRIRKITNPGGVVTTLAGSGVAAFADGTGAAASFNSPEGVAVDLSNNVIVADRAIHRIRKITNPGGVVTTLAGGSQGSADGIGTGASFYEPIGLAIDKSGKVIVADFKNNRIRRITNPGGVVTTLAGSGTGTLVDGTGTGASFFSPRGVAIDSGGNIIVADTENNRIRKITNPGGVVTTLAGRGESGSQSMNQGEDTFSLPMGVAVDSNDNIIVADTNRNCLRFLQFP